MNTVVACYIVPGMIGVLTVAFAISGFWLLFYGVNRGWKKVDNHLMNTSPRWQRWSASFKPSLVWVIVDKVLMWMTFSGLASGFVYVVLCAAWGIGMYVLSRWHGQPCW